MSINMINVIHYNAAIGLAQRPVDSGRAPRGSGLGASSALLIAILGALRSFEGRGGDFNDKLCDWAAAVEAKLIQVPTGLQDYYAALMGGPLAIDFSLYGPRPEPLEPK